MGSNGVLALLLLLVAYSLVTRWSTRHDVTGPIVFVIVGWAVAGGLMHLVQVGFREEQVKILTEATLTVVLFCDATRVNLRELRRSGGLPLRLLGLGLPLTVALGWLLAVAILPNAGNAWVPLLVAAALAPTDAALGAAIVADERVPVTVRRTLNVESGLNDGLITPIVFLAIAGAAEVEGAGTTLRGAAWELGVGALIGLVIGLVGGRLLREARRRELTDEAGAAITVLVLALLCFVTAEVAGVNGFIAAFVGGMAFGTWSSDWATARLEFSETIGQLLGLVVWFLFGALFLTTYLDQVRWQHVVYAVAALTVLRMVPVALSLVGTGVTRPTTAILGWFGPRGLATVLFGVLSAEALTEPGRLDVLPVLTVTVLLSVLAHGLTAGPLTTWYTRRPDPAVAGEVPELRTPRRMSWRRSVVSRRSTRQGGAT